MAKLYGIGVGPGDPELITLKAHRILKEADVIFCPEKEAGAGSVAFDIIKELLKDQETKIVNLVYPMHYRGDKLKQLWEENARLIAEHLGENKTGAFITLGDPAVYSTFMYTLPYMEAHGVRTEIIPGITSFCAVASTAKWPLMTWDEDLLVAPVRKNSGEDLVELLKNHDNVVLMKPSANKEAVLRALQENHLEENFVLVSKSGTGDECVVTDYAELEDYKIPYLSTIIIKRLL